MPPIPNMMYSPADVMMGQPLGIGIPYVSGNARQQTETPGPTQPSSRMSWRLGPESVRATGAGPFDPAYRQNLATYAGGQFVRPSGGFVFNPTDPATFPGVPTGGGTAPVLGMPFSLLSMALGGLPAQWSSPAPPATGGPTQGGFGGGDFWLDEFMRSGGAGRGRMRYL